MSISAPAVRTALSAAHREREWQLAPRDLEPVRQWLRKHPQLDELRIEPRPTLALHDRYFDTDTWSILRAGFALRVRHHESGTEATLKTLEKAHDGFVERLERTQPLASASVENLAASEGPVASQVQALAGAESLAVLFEAWTRRERFAVLVADERIAEIALDESRLGRADGPEPTVLTRVEIETQGNGRPELTTLVAQLRSACELESASMSKFEAGLAAAGLTPGADAPAWLREPTPDMSAAEAARLVVASQLDTFRRLETAVRLGEDAETLHDLRVAARRIAVSLRVFDEHLPALAGRLRPALRKLLRALGAAREYDVQLAGIDAFAKDLHDARRAQLEPLRHRLAQERTRARARMLKTLDAAATRNMLERLAEIASGEAPARRRAQPLATVAPAIARRRYRNLRKAASRVGADPSPERLHEVRVTAKKLRYSIESFAALYGEPARAFLRVLRRLQNVLGEHRDAHLAALRLDALAASKRRRLPGETLFLMGQLAERASGRARRSRKRFAKALRGVRGRRWKGLRNAMLVLEAKRMKRAAKARRAPRPAAPKPPAENVAV
ncbi:MAG: CYTH and CHAD domain-containing protein [Gammaproteobacteria bacterium]